MSFLTGSQSRLSFFKFLLEFADRIFSRCPHIVHTVDLDRSNSLQRSTLKVPLSGFSIISIFVDKVNESLFLLLSVIVLTKLKHN